MTFIHPSLLAKHALFPLFRVGGLDLDRLDSLSVPLALSHSIFRRPSVTY